MPDLLLLRRQWGDRFAQLINTAEFQLLVTSPYITQQGVEFVAANISHPLRANGHIAIVTDLSPLNVVQGSTDPRALQLLVAEVPNFSIRHLPRLHAKVYVADKRRAIVTSSNLTAGGLNYNFEYGVEVAKARFVKEIRRDILGYANLGAEVSSLQLTSYCEIAERVRSTFEKQQSALSRSARTEFRRMLQSAEDELIGLRLAAHSLHGILAKTILYLLRRYGPLTTAAMNALIESIHPDLCDNTVDRVINGRRFGKKWKHATRTAQVYLKRKGLISLYDGVWVILNTNSSQR